MSLNKSLFVLHCRGELFTYFWEKFPSITFNYPILNYFNNFPLIPLTSTFRGQHRIWIWMTWGSDQVRGCKGCLNCLILDPTMVDGKDNHWFLGTLKCSTSELILPAWNNMESDKKLFSLKFKFLHIFQDFWIWARRTFSPILLCATNIWLNYSLSSYTPTLSIRPLSLRIKEYKFLCKK